MTIGRKLAASFISILLMFMIVGVVIYTFNAHVIRDAVKIDQKDVPGALLSLSLVHKIEEIDTNILKYLSGKDQEQEHFEVNRQAFLTLLEQLKSIETQVTEIKVIQKLENLFSNYTNTSKQEIFNRYDPKAEQWANQQVNIIVHQYGSALEKHLEQAVEESKIFQETSLTAATDPAGVPVGLKMVNQIGQMMTSMTEYAAGKEAAQQDFSSTLTEFETLFNNQLKPLQSQPEITNIISEINLLYTKIRTSAEEVFRQYDPQTKIEAFTTVYRLEQDILKPLKETLNELATQKKQEVLTQTGEIISIITEITYTMMIVIFIAIIIGLSLSIFLARSISLPLNLIVKGSNQLVAGDMSLTGLERGEIDKIIKRTDEIGMLGRAFEAQSHYFKTVIDDLVQISQNLAAGKLAVTPQAEYRGDFIQIKTALEVALSSQRLVIDDIVNVSSGLAAGNLSVMPQSEYRGDFAQIKNAQETALSTQRQVIEDIVQVSQGLAEGNLYITSQAQYRGDFVQIKTALEAALSNLRQVLEDIIEVSQGLAEGGQAIIPKAEYRGDFVRIKNALETAANKLATATEKNAAQDWLKTGQNQLNEQMSGEQNIVELTHNIVSFLTLYLEAQVGVCYLVETSDNNKNKALKMMASYAYARGKNIAEEFAFSEGLVERAAKEQKSILITVNSELGETIPRHIIVIPFLYENTVKGIIVLGSEQMLSALQQDFLHQVMSNIGITVNSIEARDKMQQLLQKTQIQAEELQSQKSQLQTQAEELQHQKEELQNQAEELQSQAEELQSQTEELRQSNEELENRTRELERQREEIQQKNQSLEQTQQILQAKAEELELASQYKSEFLANMSHELRTPLNSLLILAQLLTENKTGNLTEKQQEYARTIHSAGSDLLTLINDILDLSKVEAGKMELHLEEVSIADLIETIEQKFRHVAEQKQLAFHLTVADDLPPVLQTDAQRLKQIINNLLSNAFKFTQAGEIKLMMQRPSDHEEIVQMGLKEIDKTIAISIADSGIGIPQDKQKIIFEAFQQADGTTSRSYGGTGLGLSISRQLARFLGGEIRLLSQENQGSTFTLYLPEVLKKPISDPPADNPPSNPNRQTVTSSPPPTFSPTPSEIVAAVHDDRATLQTGEKSILVVEDDRKFSHILLDLAREKGFKCLIAEDGKMGLQLAEQYQPQAIILDVNLPQIDGWTVMEKLKDNPSTRHIPVHFMSASDQSVDAKKMGAIGYLLKPVSMVELGEAFKKIEQFITKTLKNLLVIVENQQHQQKIIEIVGGGEIETTLSTSTTDALQQLHQTLFDCIVLDVELEQSTGINLLEQLQKEESLSQIPIIIYANRDLTPSEEQILRRCEDNLTVKAVRSPERLLDEATLFLHQLEANLTNEKRNMLRMVHDKAAILRNKKVLIVDDDMRNSFALATVLEDHEMEVIGGKNGKEALQLLEKHDDIAIVLMDVMMPEMDGYETMQQIRAQLRFHKLPIIALTAKAMKGDKAKCIQAGANDYLSKPVDTDKLISLMRVWLYR